MKHLGIGTFIGILVQLSYYKHKRTALIVKGSLVFMSKFINGFNHGSNTCASTNAESVADEAFWEDSESLLEIMCTNAFSMPVLVCIKEEKGVYDFGNAFIAAQHTLQLIKYAYEHGNLLDSYLLLRRLFESVLQYLFFIALKQDQEEWLFLEVEKSP